MSNYFSKDAFVNRIKDLRASGLSSKQIAGDFGVSYQTVDRWLRGKVNLENLTIKAYRAVMADPQAPGRLALAVRQERPPYGLEAETAEALVPYVRMLAFIEQREPDRWLALATIIESVYRDLGGGKRGTRRKTGE